ncbi:hypothetical protein D9M68_522660 [compost metagenome]
MRRGLLDLDQPGDAVHQHAGLAGTGAGKHQLTPQRGRYGLALSVVEGVQEEGEIVMHRGILGGRPEQGKPTTGRSAGRSPVPGPATLLKSGGSRLQPRA